MSNAPGSPLDLPFSYVNISGTDMCLGALGDSDFSPNLIPVVLFHKEIVHFYRDFSFRFYFCGLVLGQVF